MSTKRAGNYPGRTNMKNENETETKTKTKTNTELDHLVEEIGELGMSDFAEAVENTGWGIGIAYRLAEITFPGAEITPDLTLKLYDLNLDQAEHDED